MENTKDICLNKISTSCFLILFLFLAFLFLTRAEASPLADHPLFIPGPELRPPATDLYYEGRTLFPSEAAELQSQGYDLSTLNPESSTDLWKDEIGRELDFSEAALGVQDGSEVEYVGLLETATGEFRFNIHVDQGDGAKKLMTVLVSRNSHTILLRKALLEKMGYQVPGIDRLSRLKVNFQNEFAQEHFIKDLSYGFQVNMGPGAPERWILNYEEDEYPLFYDLQDVLIFPAHFDTVNLAVAHISPQFVRGRRLLNSLIIPFNLVDVQETVNGFRWHSVLERQNAVYVPLEKVMPFTTSYEDARWAVRRIAKLGRQDFEEIAAYANYPKAVELLITEKLISRRNELMKVFQVEGENLAFDPMVSYGEDLLDGRLIKEDWDGYATKLAAGERPSPISGSEIRALFKSKAISTGVSELVSRVNMDLMPRTDIEKLAMKNQQKEFFKNLQRFAETGEEFSTPFGVWMEPTYSTQLIAGREVVAGSFLGADNRVQLVDTFGFGADAGLYFGTHGLKPELFLDAQAKVFYVRQYAHLRPLESIEDAIKVPYKNILVPLLKKDAGLVFDEILSDEFKELPNEEKEDRLREMLMVFRDTLGDGESLIISDNYGSLAGIRAGYRFTDRVRAQAQLAGQLATISRTHIMRVGNRIHIYQDRGNLKSLSFSVSLRAEVELLEISAQFTKGVAEVNFFDLNLSPSMEGNPHVISNMLSLREIFLDNSFSRLRSVQEPHSVWHNFQQSTSRLKVLFFNHFNLKTSTRVQVKRADAPYSEYFIRRVEGKRSGNDFQTVGVDIVNHLIEEALSAGVSVSNTTSGDPGDTFYGRSRARYAYFEGLIGDQPKGTSFEESFVGVVYRWKGWQAKKEYLERLIREISEKYNYDFYHPLALHLVRRAELYNLYLRVLVYDRGIQHMAALPESEVNRIFANYHNHDPSISYQGRVAEDHRGHVRPAGEDPVRRAYNQFLRHQRSYNRQLQAGNLMAVSKFALKMVSVAENSLTAEGLILAVGGERNISIQSDLNGFMPGEDRLLTGRAIHGNEIGQQGGPSSHGPLTDIQRDLGMTESEFFIYWLLRRI